MLGNEMSVERVMLIASAVRNAIEACEPCELPWSTFPKGACGDTCLVLGQVLHDYGFNGAQYICGNKYHDDGRPYSHAWLQYDGLIVDITADQFPEVDQKVIVVCDSEWHRQWDSEKPQAGALRDYNFRDVAELWTLHSLLKPRLTV